MISCGSSTAIAIAKLTIVPCSLYKVNLTDWILQRIKEVTAKKPTCSGEVAPSTTIHSLYNRIYTNLFLRTRSEVSL